MIPPRLPPGPEFWRDVDFPLVDDEPEGLRTFVQRLRAEYQNGSVIHRTFVFPEQAEMRRQAELAFARDFAFFRHFWHCPSVRAALPYELDDTEFDESSPCAGRPFESTPSVQLPGQLATALWAGGAYSRDRPTARDAMAAGMAAAEALTQGDFDDTRVLNSSKPWSRFFHDVAWDHTWILVEPERGRIVVLMATDTD